MANRESSADLTDRVSELQATLGKMEVALAAIVEAIAWTDGEGRIQWSNAIFDRLVARGRLQVLGAKLIDLLPLEQQGQNLPIEAHPVNKALLGQVKGTGEYEFQQADGKIVLEISWSSININKQGRSAVLAIRDITVRKQEEEELRRHREELQELVEERTASLQAANEQLQREIAERKLAEENLQTSEEHFRQLAENIHEVFWLSDPRNSRTIYVSPAYEEVWDRTCKSLYEQPESFLDAIYHEDRNRLIDFLEEQKRGERSETTYRIVQSNGSIRWIRDRCFPIKDSSGQLYRVAGIAEDITSYKQAEIEIINALEKQKELNILKSGFLSTSSHEFRTPLATIVSSTELLEYYGDKLAEEKKQKLFDQVRTATKRMIELLDNVLTINKVEGGKLEVTPKVLDLEQFCRKLVGEMQLVAGDKHEIVFAYLGDCSKAFMDEKLLQHIFSNLLSNAIKYSPRGGTVYFELDCSQEGAVFKIKDSGIGIPGEDLQRLFQPFHRAKNVDNISGTGLGLSIVKQMVDLQKGKIEVASQVKVGTTFVVTIPLHLPKEKIDENH